MECIKPTYEEYCKATLYAEIRYKFGVYIQFISLILLILLICYTVINIEEMKSNPLDYAEKKLGVICHNPILKIENYNHDGSNGNITNFEET
jgi:hypothetical protein